MKVIREAVNLNEFHEESADYVNTSRGGWCCLRGICCKGC